jgi:integrase
MKTAKMVFNWAVDHDWLTKNPMKKIPNGSFINRENDRIVTMEEYAKLLYACPNQEWRSIIALAKIGGLRCPSELQQLRWSDVDWTGNRFLVRSPKTERHEGHQERLVPLFPELRAELERHYSLDETKGNEFVIELPEYIMEFAYRLSDDCEACGFVKDYSSLRQHAHESE